MEEAMVYIAEKKINQPTNQLKETWFKFPNSYFPPWSDIMIEGIDRRCIVSEH